jgi:hypothetical protein
MGKVELFKLLFRREYALDLLSQGFVSGFLIVEIFGALRGIVNDLCNLSRFKGILPTATSSIPLFGPRYLGLTWSTTAPEDCT